MVVHTRDPSAAPQDDEHVVMKCGFVGGEAAHKPYYNTPHHPERLREGSTPSIPTTCACFFRFF